MFPQQSPNVIGVAEKDNKKEKVAWINKKSKFVKITPSFAAAKVNGITAKLLLEELSLNFNIIRNILQKEAGYET